MGKRLSSGMHINSADDDTAGSAMVTHMTNQIRGMHQANKNSRGASNLLATAEAGLNDISDLLAQMRELSVQAATDTLNDSNRDSINLEFQSLKNELRRIANVTDNDADSQHQFSIMNATDVGLEINTEQVLTVDEAIDEVNRERSYIGSEQNKLQFTMSNLTRTINSIETARSNIEDVDYASEMSELAKNQILVQSSTAMLAQANMVSQNILQLLGN